MACRDIHEVKHLGVLIGYCDHQMHRLMTKKLRQYGADGQGCRLGGFLLNDRRTVHPALRMYCVESYMEKGGMSIRNMDFSDEILCKGGDAIRRSIPAQNRRGLR